MWPKTPHGSSPRARGTRRGRDPDPHRARFIPASAGNTATRWQPLSSPPVHPRACGEHRPALPTAPASSGSSPRARGTPRTARAWWSSSRFIPAPAGNTAECPSSPGRPPVHPRACGEHSVATVAGGAARGSSPRVRGTPVGVGRHLCPDRFIPARARNTRWGSGSGSSPPVHPRACGEHASVVLDVVSWFGSSPRVRGTPTAVVVREPWQRFIPARAGNTSRSRRPPPAPPVHPRACGEHTSQTVAADVSAGSSPRVRGTHSGAQAWPARIRFIPARAGNTRVAEVDHDEAPVHPRACGEHKMSARRMSVISGSSPRARGTHFPAGIEFPCHRFIPASAGNTLPGAN